MKKIYDVVVTTGEYQNKQGETKKTYLTIGSVLEGDKGLSMKLEAVPVGWNGWATFYVPKERVQGDNQSSTKSKADVPKASGAFDDFPDKNIPF
jgi:hypothetical protein